MSYHILSETENSFERTIVYQTMHENFVVIGQQKRLNEQEDWTTKDHCMLPKLFVNYVAQLPDKPQSTSGGFITSGGIVQPSTLYDPLHTYDISNLPLETRKIIYKYDCDCVPFYENQLGVLQECDNLADLWGLPKSPESPINPSPLCTPTADPSPTLSPDSTQPSPSLFSNLKNNNLWINFDDSSKTVSDNLLRNLSGDNFETPLQGGGNQEQEDTPTKNFSKTPENTETPSVVNAPKKRKISAMRELFDKSE